MKSLLRIGALLFGVLILVAIIPDVAGIQGSRSEHLSLKLPVKLSAEQFVSLGNGSTVAKVLPRAFPADNRSAESRVIRSALARPLLTPTPAPLALQPVWTPTPRPSTPVPQVGRTTTPPTSTPTPKTNLGTSQVTPGPTDVPVTWDIFVHLPPNAAQHQPLRVLLVLHGMGARGDKFAQNMIADADRNEWVVIAPTVPYEKNYLDPAQLMDEDLRFGRILHSLLNTLPQRLGLRLHQHVLIFGFSRGAQLAHRFAIFHPEHVESVAAISGGSYTLPLDKNSTQAMVFPYGIADLPQRLGEPLDMTDFKRISFWIAVGEKDNRVADVARAFDPYEGRTRVERAKALESALRSLGMNVHLTIFPNADHEVTDAMRSEALHFLRQGELADNWND